MKGVSFNDLVEQYLGARLPEALAAPVRLEDMPEDAVDFIVRMLGLMKRAACPATVFNPQIIRLISVVTPRMLPSAWGGRIPPVTAPGRHKKLDDLVDRLLPPEGNGRPVFLDLGCGFPPVTTVDTAKNLPQWSVYGADRTFARYVLYDADGGYASFDPSGAFQYFQPPMTPLHDNSDQARTRLTALFENLCPMLGPDDDPEAAAVVEKDGVRLVRNPVRTYEAENLRFVESEVQHLDLPPVHAARCMNMLLYFKKDVRRQMRAAVGDRLADGGLLIDGFNHPFGTYARYAIREKNGGSLSPREFAFSMDNLRPLGTGPWVTLSDDDGQAELLADLTAALRADEDFWPVFNARVDALQAENGVCRRGEDGFINFTKEVQEGPPTALMQRSAAVWRAVSSEGFTDQAIAALRRAGFEARENPIGDVAVSLPKPQANER